MSIIGWGVITAMALQLDLRDIFYDCGVSIIIPGELGWLSEGQCFQGRDIVYFESAT